MPRAKTKEKRTWMTFEEMPIEAQLRETHAGHWVAWAEDGESVVAVGDDPVSVHDAVRDLGSPKVVYEWVPPVPVRPIDTGA